MDADNPRLVDNPVTTESQREVPIPKRIGRRTRWLVFFLLLLIGVLIIARLLLPSYVLRYVNAALNKDPYYRGQVEDIELSLWRGAYQIKGLRIQKTEGGIRAPFFETPLVDLSVQWREIFRGRLVGEVEVEAAKLNFVNGPSRRQSQDGSEGDWIGTVRDLFPLKINRFQVNNSEIHYRDFSSTPNVDIYLAQLNASATNLTNSLKLSANRVAHLRATALAQNQSPAKLSMDLDPFNARPDFYLAAELGALNVKSLNDFLRAYASVDATSGTLSAFTELRTERNKFRGYLKLLVKDLDLIDLRKDLKKPLRFVWESVVAVVSQIFTNQRRDQIATEIPFSGTYAEPDAETWSALISVLTNAFVEAIKPGLNNELSFAPKKKD